MSSLDAAPSTRSGATSPAAPTSRSAPTARERGSRQLAFFATLALALVCLAWELWLAPTGRGTLAIKALPLLLPLPGLWRYRMYTYRWLSLMIWLYVTEGLVRGTSEGGVGMALAWVEVVLSVAIFVACAAQIRQRLAEARLADDRSTKDAR
ncbi:DUF2069 domain-containing protein [Mitsuaria sp. 7]|uniref:DUF2069 domain-containing protein n=1 Tax=Mitsuaria sp. 7 TaxID=1658665 RepID=UPI0007DD1897|nr:DUF2069 domain-containing protein [Mitsuaria sp. 7]ANH67584.1 hypothetical protein ABE85_08410 [Mitsuaria sp. 7]